MLNDNMKHQLSTYPLWSYQYICMCEYMSDSKILKI